MAEQGSVYKKSASGGTPPPLHLPNKVMFVIKQSTPDPGAHLAEVIGSPYATLEGGNPPLDYPYSLLLPSNSYINPGFVGYRRIFSRLFGCLTIHF